MGGQRTHRRVSLAPFLASILKGWLTRHPAGRNSSRSRPRWCGARRRGLLPGRSRETVAEGREGADETGFALEVSEAARL